MNIYLEIEYIDNNGGGIERIDNLEELKDFINYVNKKEEYKVFNISCGITG